jgi:hypothetical protein
MAQLHVKHKRTTYWFSNQSELERRIKEMDEQIDEMEARLRGARALQLEFKIRLADHISEQEDQKTG